MNYLKYRFCYVLNVDFARILTLYKSKLSDPIFWAIIQLHAILRNFPSSTTYLENIETSYVYLQSLANGHFDVLQMNNNYRKEARDILDKRNEAWVEEARNECNSKFKVISHAVVNIRNLSFAHLELTALSPDSKLLACAEYDTLEVFNLPRLTIILRLEKIRGRIPSKFLIFSPDSSYIYSIQSGHASQLETKKRYRLFRMAQKILIAVHFLHVA